MKKYKASDDEGWKRFYKKLEETYLELGKATSGTLLGPPMVNKQTGQAYMTCEKVESKNKEVMKIMQSGKIFIMEVRHLNKMP